MGKVYAQVEIVSKHFEIKVPVNGVETTFRTALSMRVDYETPEELREISSMLGDAAVAQTKKDVERLGGIWPVS